MALVRPSFLISRSTCKPSTLGSFRSRRTRRGGSSKVLLEKAPRQNKKFRASSPSRTCGADAPDCSFVEREVSNPRPKNCPQQVRFQLGHRPPNVTSPLVKFEASGGGGSSVKKNVAPCSGFDSAQISPPWRWTMRCTVASPIPVPSNSSCR